MARARDCCHGAHHLCLLNRGVGPAHQQSLGVKVDGRYVTSVPQLLAASLGPSHAAEAEKVLKFMNNKVRTRFIPGAQQQLVFRVAKTPENAPYWQLLQASRAKWDIEYCYCSVFQECWQVLGILEEPVPLEQCLRDEPHEFMP